VEGENSRNCISRTMRSRNTPMGCLRAEGGCDAQNERQTEDTVAQVLRRGRRASGASIRQGVRPRSRVVRTRPPRSGFVLSGLSSAGYYKIPSLKGVWYRGPFEHSGSVATLEDWFNPRRLRDDYVPTGFKGAGVTTRAVKGHPFGLSLSADDRAALIASLKTL